MSEVAIKPKKAYKHVAKSNRLFNLQEPPTFYPTKEEFKDTYKYIESISEEGAKYGIIKIIPPPSWNPKFAVDVGVGRQTSLCFMKLIMVNSCVAIQVQNSQTDFKHNGCSD